MVGQTVAGLALLPSLPERASAKIEPETKAPMIDKRNIGPTIHRITGYDPSTKVATIDIRAEIPNTNDQRLNNA